MKSGSMQSPKYGFLKTTIRKPLFASEKRALSLQLILGKLLSPSWRCYCADVAVVPVRVQFRCQDGDNLSSSLYCDFEFVHRYSFTLNSWTMRTLQLPNSAIKIKKDWKNCALLFFESFLSLTIDISVD